MTNHNEGEVVVVEGTEALLLLVCFTFCLVIEVSLWFLP